MSAALFFRGRTRCRSAFARSFLPVLPVILPEEIKERDERFKGRRRSFPRAGSMLDRGCISQARKSPICFSRADASRDLPLARSHDLSRWETLTSLIPKVTKRVPRRPSSSLGKGSRNNGPCPQWRRRQSTALYRGEWKMCSYIGIGKTDS
jgi:hypothetical protein